MWAAATKARELALSQAPPVQEVAQWVATIRDLIIAHHDQTGSWLTVAQILQRLTGA